MSAVERQAARALLLDPNGRVLLVRFINPDTGAEFWTTPGGGIAPGESLEDALRRELREETGLENPPLGPVIWIRREVFPWAGRTLDQRERVVLVEVEAFEPRPQLGSEQLAAEDVYEVRWWTLDEIERSDAVFYPNRLARFVRELQQAGPPDEPIDVGL